MQRAALDTVKNRITLGIPLPFNVRSAYRTLLLARGEVTLQSQEQLQALMLCGAPDPAIFQVLRQRGSADTQYGAKRSLQSAAARPARCAFRRSTSAGACVWRVQP